MVRVPWYSLCLFLGRSNPSGRRQVIVGAGLPLALQGNVTFSPTLFMYSSSGLSLIVGGSRTCTLKGKSSFAILFLRRQKWSPASRLKFHWCRGCCKGCKCSPRHGLSSPRMKKKLSIYGFIAGIECPAGAVFASSDFPIGTGHVCSADAAETAVSQ